MEQWKDIIGFEGYYQVSNHGNVRSVDRKIEQKSIKGNIYFRTIKSKTMSLVDNGTGYFDVGLNLDGHSYSRLIHRLVAEHYVDGYVAGFEVDHIDNDKSNNHYTNLQWVTRKYNMKKCLDANPHVINNLKQFQGL